MPRPEKDPAERLDHQLPVLFTRQDMELITQVARAHGISKGEAVRRLMRAGADNLAPGKPGS